MAKTKDPLNIVENIRAERKQRAATALVESRQLPLWGETKRGLPNVLARSALFNARRGETNNDAREFYKNTPVASLANYEISYRGEELRQDDASVFMQVLHLARQIPIGERVHFTAYSMLKELGWGTNSLAYKRLRECLERLSANNIRIAFRDDSAGYV